MRLLALLFLGLSVAVAVVDEEIISTILKKYPNMKSELAKYGITVTDAQIKEVVTNVITKALAVPQEKRAEAMKGIIAQLKQDDPEAIVKKFLELLKESGVDITDADKKRMAQRAAEEKKRNMAEYVRVANSVIDKLKGKSIEQLDALFEKEIEKLKKKNAPKEEIETVKKYYAAFKKLMQKAEAESGKKDEKERKKNKETGKDKDGKDKETGKDKEATKDKEPAKPKDEPQFEKFIYRDFTASQLFRIFFRRVLIETSA